MEVLRVSGGRTVGGGMKNMAISSQPHVLRSPFVRFVRPFLALMAPISLRMIYTRTLFGMRRRRRRKPSEASVVPASEVEDTSGRSCETKSNERSLFGENALNMELFCSDIFGFC